MHIDPHIPSVTGQVTMNPMPLSTIYKKEERRKKKDWSQKFVNSKTG